MTIVPWELALFLPAALWLLGPASALAETRDGDWLESVPMPVWWKSLIRVPPLLLAGRWLTLRRARR
jgi:hypothetical protein